ncbi:MAG TPA: DUF1232 domain-containing protein, partial [Longimicrobium sp.]|nr:DUF1232 domain-containing protein [Longimicrobium sp.]
RGEAADAGEGSRPAARTRRWEADDDDADEDDLVGPRRIQAPRLRRGASGGGTAREREGVRQLVRDIPNFLKLLGRMARDPRVSATDKALMVAAIGYVFVPSDAIPDWIPVIGELDEVVVLALALSRLLNNAGVDVLLDHWDGDPATLETALAFLDRAASVLPAGIRGFLGKRAFA